MGLRQAQTDDVLCRHTVFDELRLTFKGGHTEPVEVRNLLRATHPKRAKIKTISLLRPAEALPVEVYFFYVIHSIVDGPGSVFSPVVLKLFYIHASPCQPI